jgi:CO/xanthine dehydrogenase FAD-binding subunit
VCSFALALHPVRRTVAGCIGSAGPTVLPTPDAEQYLEAELADRGLWDSRSELDEAVATRFGELAGAHARPIDDVRGTADYRRHAVAVLARRTLQWTWTEYRRAQR